MAVEERRRIALHRAAAASWGEEVADTLVELVAPSGHELATRADIRGILDAMAAMDERWDERFVALEARWDERFVSGVHRGPRAALGRPRRAGWTAVVGSDLAVLRGQGTHPFP
jgi:hypothetical protein